MLCQRCQREILKGENYGEATYWGFAPETDIPNKYWFHRECRLIYEDSTNTQVMGKRRW